MEARILDRIAQVPAQAWDAVAGTHPFVRHAFLAALEDTGCACPATGWRPRHLVLQESGRILGALPLYEKTHSYGEFVFDWAWADAYRRHGMAYYPKWIAAIPFTPVTGPRLLAPTDSAKTMLVAEAVRHAREANASSFHLLFATGEEARTAEAAGLLARRDVQFHWRNEGYGGFEDFLAALAGSKRRKILQERRRVAAAGIQVVVVTGPEAAEADWHFLFACHCNTLRAHGRSAFLSESFFQRLAGDMPENLVLFIARRNGRPIGGSLCLRDADRLYGRYWGSVEEVSCLHFEACYYAPIEFCIRERLAVFEGGAQGEHKLARGFLPVETRSAHWLAHPAFATAVDRYLERERAAVAEYAGEMASHSPFR